MDQPFTLRAMTPRDLELAVGWAAAEGWNPGQGDATPFLAADSQGFLMGFLGEEPVTSISVVAYGEAFGFLGFYICRPEWRGRGLGMATWTAGLERLGSRTVGLDGVVAQQENYRRSGFELAHRNIRHGGRVAVERPADPALVAVDASLLARIVRYDRGLFPAPRTAFLESWLRPEAGRRAYAVLRDGELRGYGVIRPAVTGFKIGPLFAESEADADLIFRALAAEAGGEMLFLDPPEPNAAAMRLVARHGLQPAFETARMYRGADPGLPLPRIFGITSFELG